MAGKKSCRAAGQAPGRPARGTGGGHFLDRVVGLREGAQPRGAHLPHAVIGEPVDTRCESGGRGAQLGREELGRQQPRDGPEANAKAHHKDDHRDADEQHIGGDEREGEQHARHGHRGE
eukprot:scaffold141176_cov27-Tisochrysis_lutea.AAC.3